jgi:asparaginyl-tRNA synthetase
MMDAEMAFFTHQDNMALQEQLITFIVKSVLEKNQLELKILERDTKLLEKVNAPFPRITHRDLVTLLRERGSEINYDSDLGAKDEELLAQIYDVPVFIEKWPSQIKAFYMKRDPSDSSLVLGADLMAPEGFGELIGGSQREDDIEVLLEKAKEENLPLDSFKWYLDLRRYGSVPHSGFGFGLERLVTWIAGVEHIRETIPFPRMIYRITP